MSSIKFFLFSPKISEPGRREDNHTKTCNVFRFDGFNYIDLGIDLFLFWFLVFGFLVGCLYDSNERTYVDKEHNVVILQDDVEKISKRVCIYKIPVTFNPRDNPSLLVYCMNGVVADRNVSMYYASTIKIGKDHTP